MSSEWGVAPDLCSYLCGASARSCILCIQLTTPSATRASTSFPSWEGEGYRVEGVDATAAAIICAVHGVELHRVQPLLPCFLSLYRSQLLFHFAGVASYEMTAIVALGMAGVVCSLADERTSLSSSCLGSPSGKLHPTTAVTFRVTNRFNCSYVFPT